MTTIIYDSTRKQLACDLQITVGNNKHYAKSKFYITEDYVLALAGDVVAGQMFAEEFARSYKSGKLYTEDSYSYGLQGILVLRDGLKHYLLLEGKVGDNFITSFVEVTDKWLAVGSGGDMALGIAFTNSTYDCEFVIDRVSALDAYTDSNTQVFDCNGWQLYG
jgi:ATP-dependent protease HslVU (ClpYQ) peptidase subunit